MSELLSDPVFLGGAGALLMGVIGWLVNKLWQARMHAMKNIQQSIASQGASLSLKADKADFEHLAALQREDHREVLAELRNTNELIGSYVKETSREVALRPTREEVERMIDRAHPA